MAVTPNYSWPIPVATDYVKDGWDAIADLGNAIDTTVAGLGSAGMTLVTATTMSAVTTISVNNCFNSTYDNYRIVVAGTISSGDDGMLFRLRASGTDLSSTSYTYGRIERASGGFVTSSSTATGCDIGTVSVNGFSSSFDVFSPYLAKYKFVNGMSYRRSGSYAFCLQGNSVDSSSSYDGFSIICGTAMTGTLKVYGYKN